MYFFLSGMCDIDEKSRSTVKPKILQEESTWLRWSYGLCPRLV